LLVILKSLLILPLRTVPRWFAVLDRESRMNELITRSAPSAADGPMVNWSEKHCLVIDDFAGIRRLLRESLRSLGVKNVDQASNGSEAIGLIARARYDIILCDYNLNEGKNGQQVLEEARSKNFLLPSCIFIIVSAEKNVESVIGLAEHQPDAYLIKPITEGTLVTRLNRIWQKKQCFKPIDQAFADKDWLVAAAACETAIDKDPTHELELLRMKAQLQLKAGESGQARETYERILQDHDCHWAKVGIAKIRMQDGDYESARLTFQQVVAENRYYIEAYDQLAAVYQQLGQGEEARNVLERASKMSPNSVSRQKALGEVALRLGNVELAEKAFRKCISVGEHSINKTPEAYLGLARVCGIKNEPKEALAMLATAQKEFTSGIGGFRAMTIKGLVLQESGDHRHAREVGQEIVEAMETTAERPDAHTCIDMASLLFATGYKDAAVDLLCHVTKNNDDDKWLLDDVQKLFDKVSMGDEGSVLILASRKEASDTMNQGVLLWKTGKVEEAAEWMRKARATLPYNLRILINSAQILISHLQSDGPNAAIAGEASDVLHSIDKLWPGHYRYTQLMEQLHALSPEIAGVPGAAEREA
jgi:CheY-like chemotaxis protein